MIATAAMLAGTFHAPLFGAMMIFEMSGNYELLLPLLFAAAGGCGLAHRFHSQDLPETATGATIIGFEYLAPLNKAHKAGIAEKQHFASI